MGKTMITPKTKISELLNNYPELEDILIKYTPAFKKLKNPVLRKTIAKITTLQQTSAIAGVKVEDLINTLRKEVGQDTIDNQIDGNYNYNKPEWYNAENITKKFDAREMLSGGEHPVNQVLSDLKEMKNGGIYELLVPFLPAPLIDKATSILFDHWVKKKSDTEFYIYFCNNN